MTKNRAVQRARQAKAAQKRHSRDVKQRTKSDSSQNLGPGRVVIRAPDALTFRRESNDETVQFLHRIYEEVIVKGKRAAIDLRNVKAISFGAALALVAEINRAQEIRPGHVVHGALPKKPRLAKILHDIGFIAATSPGLSSPLTVPDTHLLKVHSGLAETVTDTAFLDGFLKRIFPPEAMSDKVRGRLKGAVTEALLNVVDHAYSPKHSPEQEPLKRRWWICGSADPKEGCIFVVYDLGAGIPATVPTTAAEEIIDAYAELGEAERREDFELIKIAVTHPTSRTGTPGRGRGLPEMRRLIDRVGDGMLWITSGHGHYIYARGEREVDGGFAMNFRLHGTLVVWRLKVSEALDDAGGDG